MIELLSFYNALIELLEDTKKQVGKIVCYYEIDGFYKKQVLRNLRRAIKRLSDRKEKL